MSLQCSESSSQSKHFKMKQLVGAIQDYFHTKRQDSAMIINMHLQSLSIAIDLSVFDPHTNIASQFFVSLYELMNKMEERSTFAWNCVDVLANACRNPSARFALIHTYQFIPSLSRLLSDHLSDEKKTRLLRLMQVLTCGIKISWQIPHLPTLMITLTRWIESPQEDIQTLALGILVNLCYKNLPAIYTLMGNVDMKKILSVCSSITSPATEIYTCKLLIILDHMNSEIPRSVLTKVVTVTFENINEAFRLRDAIFLRQIVEFFLDVARANSLDFLADDVFYERHLNALADVIDNNCSMETGDADSDPECIALIFEFINYLIEIRLAAISRTYPAWIGHALKWIHNDVVSEQALAVLKSIAVNVEAHENAILEPLVQGLPVFIMTLEGGRSDDCHIEQGKKLAGLVQLLRAMVQVEGIRGRILQELKVETIRKVFGAVLDEEQGAGSRLDDPDVGTVDTINLYTHGVALIDELAKWSAEWREVHASFMEHKQIHMILAQCLYESSKDVKSVVLELSTRPHFPRQKVAEAMALVQPASSSASAVTSRHALHELNFPVLSASQIHRIDSVLAKFQEIFAQKQDSSVLTSDVIELYDYKLASMSNAERAALASVEAASEQCTHLQHRNAQLKAETNRLLQMLYHLQQCNEQAVKLKDNLSENVEKLQGQVDVDKGRLRVLKQQLSGKEAENGELRAEVEEMKKKLEKVGEGRRQVDEDNARLSQCVQKLEQHMGKLEKVVVKKDDSIKRLNCSIDSLNSKIGDLETNLTQKEAEIHRKAVELKSVTKELNARKHILDTITNMAMKSQVAEQ